MPSATLSGLLRLTARVPRIVWLVLGTLTALLLVYQVGRWKGHAAGVADAQLEVVHHALEHNAEQLRPAEVAHDSARKNATRMVRGADSTRQRFSNARAAIVVVNDSTLEDTAMHRVLHSPLAVQVVRTADAMKIQDSLTIVAVTARAEAAERVADVLRERVMLLEQENAIIREEHRPVIGRAAGIGMTVLGVGLAVLALH